MANPHLNKFNVLVDAELIHQLTSDFIYDHGTAVMYLSKERILVDEIMHEDIVTQFNDAIEIDIFMEVEDSSFSAPNGIFDFAGFSFGRNSTSIHFDRQKAEILLGKMPQEGDLIYIKEIDTLLEITDVDKRDFFLNGGDGFYVSAYVSTYAPSEGTQHFSDEVKDLSRSLELLSGSMNPKEILEATGLTADNDRVTADHNWNLLDLDRYIEMYTADSMLRAPSTSSFTADTSILTADDDEYRASYANNLVEPDLDLSKNTIQDLLTAADNDEIEDQELSKPDTNSTNNPFGFW